MSDERWSIEEWQGLLRVLFRPEHVAFFPHKVFRWDTEEIYRDCYFPFRCKHFLGGERILGKSINEVLPKQASLTLKKSFGLIRRRGVPQDIQCLLPNGQKSFVASVRLFPYGSEILGFVTDHDLSGAPVIKITSDHPSLRFLRVPSGN